MCIYSQRLTAQECLNHPWLRTHTPDLSTPIKSPLSSPAGHRRSLTSPSSESHAAEPTKRCRCESPKAGSEVKGAEPEGLVAGGNAPSANQKSEASVSDTMESVTDLGQGENIADSSASESASDKLDQSDSMPTSDQSGTTIDITSSPDVS